MYYALHQLHALTLHTLPELPHFPQSYPLKFLRLHIRYCYSGSYKHFEPLPDSIRALFTKISAQQITVSEIGHFHYYHRILAYIQVLWCLVHLIYTLYIISIAFLGFYNQI